MKTIITSLAILISLGAYSQIGTMIESPKKWKIGITGSFDMIQNDFYSTFYNQGFAPGGCYEPLPNSEQYQTRGYSAGVVGQYSITPRLEAGVGAVYSKQFNNYSFPTYYGDECYIDFFYVHKPSNFLEVPLFVRYNFLKTKLNFHVESGVTTNYVLDNYSSANSKFSLKGQSGLGMSYTFMDLINVSATAFYKRRLTDFSRITNYNSPNSFSFELRTAIIF